MAPATVAAPTSAHWRDWRRWPQTMSALWRTSLRFRTLAVTTSLTALAVFVICLAMALAVQNDLFESRKKQVLDDAVRAVGAAQTILYSAEVHGDRGALQALMQNVAREITRVSASDQLAVYRMDAEPSAVAPRDFTLGGFDDTVLTPALRARVTDSPDSQWWQSVALTDASGGSEPGIVVGQQLQVPEAGPYELYIAYDMAGNEQTLIFVQRTLLFAGTLLVALIAAISWLVLRSVSLPIVEASETSARLASGDLGVRIDVHGEDELAVLGQSFNAMADSIERQIKELGELSLVQQRFVSDVSHELRTPLTTIRLAADMINDRKEEFDATTARAAELLYDQVQRFELLLGDLLEISRYDAGSEQLELEPTSLAQLAEDVIEQIRPLAEEHGSELRLVAPGGYSPVEMDPRRIRRVLRNLIGNAIEHGEGRPVVVTVDSNQQAVAASVRDFGMGLAPADLERVFDRFWRADPSRQRTIGGTGLGLSIALGDARLHGGTLEVWSELGVGTNFVLTVPRGAQPVEGHSPLPLEPQDSVEALGSTTQPITVTGFWREQGAWGVDISELPESTDAQGVAKGPEQTERGRS